MNQLIIKLSGQLQSSNFDDWKLELISQIKAIETNLTTDQDFTLANENVKLLKKAEASLKKSKESAILQLENVNKLFSAIDEISGETRQVRLLLERQIKVRKAEIKNALVESGIEQVRSFIDEHSSILKNVPLDKIANKDRYIDALKGKQTKQMQSSVDELVLIIKSEILERSREIRANLNQINDIKGIHQTLFPDRNSLASLAPEELKAEIRQRIDSFDAEALKVQTGNQLNELKKREEIEISPEAALPGEGSTKRQIENFTIEISLLSNVTTAKEIAKNVRETFSDRDGVSNIKLLRSKI